jgi:hypothetical protein
MNTRWHDLIIDRLPDGGIHLEQQSGLEEPNVIRLHREQLLFAARQLCGMTSHTAEQVQELERRIAVLTDKLQNLVCNKAFRSDLIERLGDGFEYLAKLDGLLDLALEFDGGRLEPDHTQSHDDDDKPIYPPSAIAQVKQTQPRAITEGCEQLGLAV